MGILLTDVLACAAAFLASATFTPAARDLAFSFRRAASRLVEMATDPRFEAPLKKP